MLFNSLDFAIFLPAVFALYWFVFARSLAAQNILLLVASYWFYACWDYRFLFLLLFSTVLDYYSGIRMAEASSHLRKSIWFWTSVSVNLGLLGVFKYFNFFIESFSEILQSVGMQPASWTLEIILPVGISFYTFHGLSYVIDIYKNKISAERNFVEYAVFVSFFPLLVAGPIERATHLLPQIKCVRSFKYEEAVDGLRQILWGLVKKVVIADNCAVHANAAFENPVDNTGSTLLLGVFFFAFQIYGDFSGYSDIALGTAKLFGIRLLRNFAYPYFSRDIAEFWRRWHISLSSWFRDYVYIPLGGSRGGTIRNVRNVFIVFLLSGFWHGASWNFVVWGAINAAFFLPLLLSKNNRANLNIVGEGKLLPSVMDVIRISTTFSLICLAWIFFRAKSLKSAMEYIAGICSLTTISLPQFPDNASAFRTLILIICFVSIEWIGREAEYAIGNVGRCQSRALRWGVYYCLLLAVYFAGRFDEATEFIYFQF